MIVADLSGSGLTEERLLAETTGASNRRRGQRVVERPVTFPVIRGGENSGVGTELAR